MRRQHKGVISQTGLFSSALHHLRCCHTRVCWLSTKGYCTHQSGRPIALVVACEPQVHSRRADARRCTWHEGVGSRSRQLCFQLEVFLMIPPACPGALRQVQGGRHPKNGLQAQRNIQAGSVCSVGPATYVRAHILNSNPGRVQWRKEGWRGQRKERERQRGSKVGAEGMEPAQGPAEKEE